MRASQHESPRTKSSHAEINQEIDTWDFAVCWVDTGDVMYTGTPFILLVHAVQANKVLLSMTGNLCQTNMLRWQVSTTETICMSHICTSNDL